MNIGERIAAWSGGESEGYQASYLQSANGAGPYVISDYIPALDDEFHFVAIPWSGASGYSPFGTCTSWRRKAFAIFSNQFWVGEKQYTSMPSIKTLETVDYVSRQLSVNGSTVYDFSEATEEPTTPLFIFAVKNQNLWSGSYQADFKLVSIMAKRNGALVANLVPWVDKDGVACIRNTVTKRNFYNADTGSFIAGPIVVGGVSHV